MRISVIIPALNERDNLPATVASIRDCGERCEILIVDGGSADGTVEWAAEQSGITVVVSARGRGAQLNAGAKAATGDILLFLHADSLLPDGALSLAARQLDDPGISGGAFGVAFGPSASLALRATGLLINARSRAFRVATGDQAIFCRREDYIRAGGFPEWPLFEDMEFVSRLRRRGRFVVGPLDVTISPRRWETFGVGRTNLLMCALYAGYRCGIRPATLKRWFADVRR